MKNNAKCDQARDLQAGEKTSFGLMGLEPLRALEPRILLDAAIEATSEAVTDSVATDDIARKVHEQVIGDRALLDAFATIGSGSPTTYVFIDASVSEIESLSAEFGPNTAIHILDKDQDGIEQMASLLSGASGVESIHIFAHGSETALNLGSAILTSETMRAQYADELTAIGNVLTETGDILIYGCDFGSDVELLQVLAVATDADIAASSDITGSAARGGDWDLEARIGTIEADSVSPETFLGILAAPVANDDGPISITGNTPLIIDPRVDNGATGTVGDTDGDGDPLTITQIIDPRDGTSYALVDSTPITLVSGTVIERQIDGSLEVTTTRLAFGQESFDYIVSDGNGNLAQATITLDRSRGGLVTAPPSASGTEDSGAPLNITVDPAIFDGGSQLDVIGTATGYRDASAGSTPTSFDIPPGTTAIRITGFGGNDAGSVDSLEEEYQTTSVTVNLVNGTYSGHIFHQTGAGSHRTD